MGASTSPNTCNRWAGDALLRGCGMETAGWKACQGRGQWPVSHCFERREPEGGAVQAGMRLHDSSPSAASSILHVVPARRAQRATRAIGAIRAITPQSMQISTILPIILPYMYLLVSCAAPASCMRSLSLSASTFDIWCLRCVHQVPPCSLRGSRPSRVAAV